MLRHVDVKTAYKLGLSRLSNLYALKDYPIMQAINRGQVSGFPLKATS